MPFLQKLNDTKDVVSDYIKSVDSKSAISLASAAALVVALTTTLTASFASLPAALTALVLSFIFAGTMIEEWYKKIFQFLIVGLVIFHVAQGGNATLDKTEDAIRPTPQTRESYIPHGLPDLPLTSKYFVMEKPLTNSMSQSPMAPVSTFDPKFTPIATPSVQQSKLFKKW